MRVGLRSRVAPNLRSGISLLEVLFSIFVLSVGLLGLMAMVPVGGIQIGDAGRADRSAACATAAMAQIKTRGLLDPHMWSNANGAPVIESAAFPPAVTECFYFFNGGGGLSDAGNYFGPGMIAGGFEKPVPPFAIDPLFVAQNATTFPTNARNFATDGATFRIPRITLGPDILNPNGSVNTSRAVQRQLLPDTIFTWRDDLVFNPTDDDLARPVLQNNALGYSQQVAGDYSWLITVSPSPADSGREAHARRSFTVSVVVFYKRDLGGSGDAVPPERLASVVFPSLPGIGGGDCTLGYAGGQQADYLKVRPGQWILLIGGHAAPGGQTQVVARWYRIVAAAKGNDADEDKYGYPRSGYNPPASAPGDWNIDVTLSGPDWNLGATGFAGIYDGVVGVYEKTIELDHGSLWTDPHAE